MDIQATSEVIKWAVNGLTILLMIIAASLAIKKKNNLAVGVVIVGNLAAYYFTRSPLICMIISIACIIWVNSVKSPEQKQEAGTSQSKVAQKKTGKVGNIIGLILGIGFVAGPLIGYLRQEASLSSPTTQGILILFAVIGAFMIINNLFKLLEKGEGVSSPSQASRAKVSKTKSKGELSSGKKIRCRFCKRLYSAEYNGCPYCKKK